MTIRFFDKIFQVFILVLLWTSVAVAYDDQTTHPKLTIAAIASSNLEAYLMSNFGNDFANGVRLTFINGKSVRDWLTHGATVEDDGPGWSCRPSTHFHNPLRPWLQAGQDQLLLNLMCTDYKQPGYSSKYSALTWATGYTDYEGPIDSRKNQYMGWDSARSYFYFALTAYNKTSRDDYFAKTFQAVGQVMHLLQDMAVPAHVRNDFITSHFMHIGFKNPYESYVTKDGVFDADTQNIIIPQFTNTVTSDFWDKNIYTGAAPVAIMANSYGLAEYTNANFMREGTIFSPDFPYPAKANTTSRLVEVMAEDGKKDTRYYIYPNNQDYTLAAYSYFANEVQLWDYMLDDVVYHDYAQLLLPRAVG